MGSCARGNVPDRRCGGRRERGARSAGARFTSPSASPTRSIRSRRSSRPRASSRPASAPTASTSGSTTGREASCLPRRWKDVPCEHGLAEGGYLIPWSQWTAGDVRGQKRGVPRPAGFARRGRFMSSARRVDSEERRPGSKRRFRSTRPCGRWAPPASMSAIWRRRCRRCPAGRRQAALVAKQQPSRRGRGPDRYHRAIRPARDDAGGAIRDLRRRKLLRGTAIRCDAEAG